MIRNWFNHDPLSGRKAVEQPYGISMTIPDQAMPLRQIIDRFVRGVEVYVNDPVYLGEGEEFAGVERMSVLDRLDSLMQLNASIAAERTRLQARADARREEAAVQAAATPAPVTEDQIMTPDKKSKKESSSKKDDNG